MISYNGLCKLDERKGERGCTLYALAILLQHQLKHSKNIYLTNAAIQIVYLYRHRCVFVHERVRYREIGNLLRFLFIELKDIN